MLGSAFAGRDQAAESRKDWELLSRRGARLTQQRNAGLFEIRQMKGRKKIRIAFYSLALGGAALFTFLLVRQGAPQVGAAFASAGWWIGAVLVYHFAVPLLLDATAWWVLFPARASVAVATILDALDRRIGEHASAFRCCWRRRCPGAVGGAPWCANTNRGGERSRRHHARSVRPDWFYAPGVGFDCYRNGTPRLSRVLIVQGLRDPNVTPENVRAASLALQAHNVEFQTLVFDDEGHGISRPKNQKALYEQLATFFGEAFRPSSKLRLQSAKLRS